MKKEMNLSPSASEKVVKIYQAVIQLLDEGWDINSLKVSDITSRAGIGKGTAYEYFESKEEILLCAMKYDLQEQFESLCQCNQEVETFRERVMATFGWIEKNISSGSRRIQIFATGQLPCGIPNMFFGNAEEEKLKNPKLEQLLLIQEEAASREGLWKKDGLRAVFNQVLISGYMEYFLYLLHREDGVKGFNGEEMREFIYQSLTARINLL